MIDLTNLRYAETKELELRHPATKKPLGWTWTLAGPGHPVTIANQAKIQARMNAEEIERRKAMVEGRFWEPDAAFDAEKRRRERLEPVAGRVLSFPPAKLNGKEYTFSTEAALELLLDRSLGWILDQVSAELGNEAAFLPRSAPASDDMPSTPSG